MMNKFKKLKRYTLFFAIGSLYLLTSFLLRIVFLTWNFHEAQTDVISVIKSLVIGTFFDLGTLSYFLILWSFYLFFFPSKWIGNIVDKTVQTTYFIIISVIFYFSFFAEITFWEEFQRRFNFIAVDYLIYTYEVIQNINESYPLPFLISGIIGLELLTVWFLKRKRIFKLTFKSNTSRITKAFILGVNLVLVIGFGLFVNNESAEWSNNRYNNEISKTGIYSFFAAFRNNNLKYKEFYLSFSDKKAFKIVQDELNISSINKTATSPISRTITNTQQEITPNIILICIESLSADFMKAYGNEKKLTPFLDSLRTQSISFENLNSTGTRTVRGMEALSLSIPPTPGRSIVKRENNEHLFTVGEVFKNKGYENTFFYGGDGYFDNMNHFFSNNGFNIVDRGRKLLNIDDILTKRTLIEDEEVNFENAWGVSDEDLYDKVLKVTDALPKNQPFFHFIMTTSNHRPYTYPEGKIDIPSGTNRNGAVKYTDFAIKQFLKKASKKEWYKNTVFVIVADHCASSAGKWELNINNYHIPAFIYNFPNKKPFQVKKLSSQIDLLPSLFGLMNWSYESNFYGQNVFEKNYQPRAFIGNYRKLGLLKDDHLIILNDHKSFNNYQYVASNHQLYKKDTDSLLLNLAIANYQTADWLFRNQGLTIKTKNEKN